VLGSVSEFGKRIGSLLGTSFCSVVASSIIFSSVVSLTGSVDVGWSVTEVVSGLAGSSVEEVVGCS
jgi:hypothetical protein